MVLKCPYLTLPTKNKIRYFVNNYAFEAFKVFFHGIQYSIRVLYIFGLVSSSPYRFWRFSPIRGSMIPLAWLDTWPVQKSRNAQRFKCNSEEYALQSKKTFDAPGDMTEPSFGWIDFHRQTTQNCPQNRPPTTTTSKASLVLLLLIYHYHSYYYYY